MIETISRINSAVNGFIWGVPAMIALMGVGIYLSIRLTNNEVIKEINNEYRNIDKATDVLSFPMFEKT